MSTSAALAVICQHSVWGSKQQRFRLCKLPAKLDPVFRKQIQQWDQERIQQEQQELEQGQDQRQSKERVSPIDRFLARRAELLKGEYDAGRVLCGHHQKEAAAAEVAATAVLDTEDTIDAQESEKSEKRQQQQPVDPKDIPTDFLQAIGRVFSEDPSALVREFLEDCDGAEEWKMGRNGSVRGKGYQKEVQEEENTKEQKNFPCHVSFEGLFPDAGVKKRKHLAQESQLIESMSSLGLLRPVLEEQEKAETAVKEALISPTQRNVFVEFGAGTGGLSRHLQLALETLVPSTQEPFNFVLLDRQKFRSRTQVDYMIRSQPRPVLPRLLRITKDVRDLRLEDLQRIHDLDPGQTQGPEPVISASADPDVSASPRVPTHYICISKHFCGPATDLALSWMKDQCRKQKEQGRQGDSYSICFATCCHGICEPSLVVATPYLKELFNTTKKRKRTESGDGLAGLGVTEEEKEDQILDDKLQEWLPWMIRLTGWATLGKQEENSLVSRPGKDAVTNNDPTAMTRDQRRVLGKRCKKLLDLARILFLVRECGFKEARAIEYTVESVESGAIVGTMYDLRGQKNK